MHTDPIADMLTRIRNANKAGFEKCDVQYSNMKLALAKVLKEEGFIKEFKVFDEESITTKSLRVYLKYLPDGRRVINEIKRQSKPGCRNFKGVRKLPKVLDGLGVGIVSTHKGVMSDRECRKLRLGGELLCTIW